MVHNMIEIRNVSKRFKNNEVFRNMSVELSAGQKIMIKGPNGSGKSVLLRLIVGYSKPDSGVVVVDGCFIGKDRDFIRNAGVSIDAPEFIREYTGLQNMENLARIRKIASREDILILAEKLGMEKEIYKEYKTYSLGMKQKLRLIQALMDKPQYLILDEPFDALDDEGVLMVQRVMKEYCNNQTTLIMTNHISELDTFADTIFQINNHTLERLDTRE